MSKQLIPLIVEDVTAFARALSMQLSNSSDRPGHLALLNMLARASGFRNFQHLRASHSAAKRLANEAVPETVDHHLVERTLNHFDDKGNLVRWPSRRSIQDLSMWALWAQLPAEVILTEREVNDRLNTLHLFEDPAILRRSLVTQKLFTRKQNGSEYRRVERAPSANARELISLIGRRKF